jgi:putative ABC transport system ATP-binding protein
MKKILQVRNLEKTYGNGVGLTKAVDRISFDVVEGEFVGIMGASGSGKTALLNCISTIDTPTAGIIRINGCDLSDLSSKALAAFRRDRLGFVLQDPKLLDSLTVYENIALALAIAKCSSKEMKDRVLDFAARLEIQDLLQKYPYQLSLEEKQRVAAARAIVTDPALILADEPTGALDSASAKNLLAGFQKMNEEMKATILMVTHDPFAASWCSRILFIRDGRLVHEMDREKLTQKEFFNEILDVVSVLGGLNELV